MRAHNHPRRPTHSGPTLRLDDHWTGPMLIIETHPPIEIHMLKAKVANFYNNVGGLKIPATFWNIWRRYKLHLKRQGLEVHRLQNSWRIRYHPPREELPHA